MKHFMLKFVLYFAIFRVASELFGELFPNIVAGWQRKAVELQKELNFQKALILDLNVDLIEGMVKNMSDEELWDCQLENGDTNS